MSNPQKLESRIALRRRLKAGVFMALLGVQAAVGMASPAQADARTPDTRTAADRAESVRASAERLNLTLGDVRQSIAGATLPWFNLWTNWNNWKNWNNWANAWNNWNNAWNNWSNAWNNWHNVWYNV